MLKKARARAHANIALIKYWGKKDEKLSLPMNSSLSMTLDCFYTDTELEFRQDLEEDRFYLDGSLQTGHSLDRVVRFIDLFREEAQIQDRALVRSVNHVPTAAGLASSASGFAALAGAVNKASGLNLGARELSSYSRMGSGSSTRSIYGGFVEWQEGESHETSYARKIDEGDWDIGMIIVVVNREKKAISSRAGMKHTVETSPFYSAWVDNAGLDIQAIKSRIRERDLVGIGEIAERNALMMHGTMMGARPPLVYWQKETLEVMEIVEELRDRGIPCYFTMDAGPNVKILSRKSDHDRIFKRLSENFDEEKIIRSGVGPGLRVD